MEHSGFGGVGKGLAEDHTTRGDDIDAVLSAREVEMSAETESLGDFTSLQYLLGSRTWWLESRKLLWNSNRCVYFLWRRRRQHARRHSSCHTPRIACRAGCRVDLHAPASHLLTCDSHKIRTLAQPNGPRTRDVRDEESSQLTTPLLLGKRPIEQNAVGNVRCSSTCVVFHQHFSCRDISHRRTRKTKRIEQKMSKFSAGGPKAKRVFRRIASIAKARGEGFDFEKCRSHCASASSEPS